MTTHRADYRPPVFLVDTVDLSFELAPKATLVRSRLALRRNTPGPLRLDGEALELLDLKLDGAALSPNRYTLHEDGSLEIADPPDACTLELTVRTAPEANSELSGLYLSGGNYFTQCEAEGFRRITWFPDRPDVMARYTTEIIADQTCPILLSNGNPGETGTLPDGRHFARWADPHPKPSYLFALVAGDLVSVRDAFTTRSGRHVALAIWVRRGDEDKCAHAMASLKASMQWDEDKYGLEYDLDVFNIAAVSDFNMGAMENKGLNVFNTKYVLARPDTATDADYEGIESVIAHEYFHNWTGDRVTCRDWFQLSLKEGLTVFRDQQFSADMGSPAVKRLSDVLRLRAAQFAEDAGPLAHPVRPDSYVAIDNFYTATIYNKGAEIVRMLHTMTGEQGFRRGMDTYIARHDNQAVTIEDFVSAIEAGSGVDLSAFRAWYGQAGTPEVTVSEAFDPATGRYTLTLRQHTPPTPGQPTKHPLPIPVEMGLLAPDGAELATRRLLLTEASQDFVFDNLPARPVPSLLRGFSAPVKLAGLTSAQLRFLAAHDTDPFVRWDSGQTYAAEAMLAQLASPGPRAPDPGVVEAFAATLANAETGAGPAADHQLAARALLLPSEGLLGDRMTVVDVDGIHALRQAWRAALGRQFDRELRATHARLADPGPYRKDGAAIGRRALRNVCLAYLAAAGDVALAAAQYTEAGNMTDRLAALTALAAGDSPERAAALADFHATWRHDPLVLDQWFALQAAAPRPTALAEIRRLASHPDFDLRNPNRARALFATFAGANLAAFHATSGEGYRLLADAVIEIDAFNGQNAARMVGPLCQWRRQTPARAALMRAELERVLAAPGCSRLVGEKGRLALG
jgi:aminopeptidase N